MSATATWKNLGEVVASLQAVTTQTEANAFLYRAIREMPEAWHINIPLALNRYVPEAIGEARTEEIKKLIGKAWLQ